MKCLWPKLRVLLSEIHLLMIDRVCLARFCSNTEHGFILDTGRRCICNKGTKKQSCCHLLGRKGRAVWRKMGSFWALIFSHFIVNYHLKLCTTLSKCLCASVFWTTGTSWHPGVEMNLTKLTLMMVTEDTSLPLCS